MNAWLFSKKYRITIVVTLGLVAVALFSMFAQKYVVLPAAIRTTFPVSGVEQGLASFNEYTRGEVIEVVSEEVKDFGEGITTRSQELRVRFFEQHEGNTEMLVLYEETPSGLDRYKIKKGTTVVMGVIESEGEREYIIVDRYRLPGVIGLVVLFFTLVLLFARWRGFTSFIALLFSVSVIVFFLAPNILRGGNPLIFALISAVLISVVSMFLAHGFSKRTLLAVVSTLGTLGLTQIFAVLAVHSLHLFGTGSVDALYLQSGLFGSVELRGLLLAGIVIGTLGVLDDVTATQTASVEELHKANTLLGRKELYKRALSIGKEHIVALVNTLVLVYASVALPLLLLILSNSSQPLWTLLNSEPLVEELVRTLVGSIAIVLAVPISTVVAAYFFGKNSIRTQDSISGSSELSGEVSSADKAEK